MSLFQKYIITIEAFIYLNGR